MGKPVRAGSTAHLARCVTAWLLGLCALAARAAEVPDLQAMQALIGAPSTAAIVVEPHLSTREREVRVRYRGWPAPGVLNKLLGPAWRAPGVEVEFRALDGYVSRIPNERFAAYAAWLVFERIGHPAFTLDNLQQNEKDVRFGPYYLVWDNIGHPELLREGATYWPNRS